VPGTRVRRSAAGKEKRANGREKAQKLRRGQSRLHGYFGFVNGERSSLLEDAVFSLSLSLPRPLSFDPRRRAKPHKENIADRASAASSPRPSSPRLPPGLPLFYSNIMFPVLPAYPRKFTRPLRPRSTLGARNVFAGEPCFGNLDPYRSTIDPAHIWLFRCECDVQEIIPQANSRDFRSLLLPMHSCIDLCCKHASCQTRKSIADVRGGDILLGSSCLIPTTAQIRLFRSPILPRGAFTHSRSRGLDTPK